MQTPKQSQKKDATTFGGRVEMAREQMGWSQEDLAQRISSSSKTISRYERRVNPPRDERIVQDIAEATGAPLAWLLSGQEGPSHDSDQNASPDEIDITGGIFAGGKVQEEDTPRSVQTGRAGKRGAKGATVRTRVAAEGGEIVEFGGAKGEGVKISADTISVQGIRVHLSHRRSGFDITISFRAVPEASPASSGGGGGDRADVTISGERLEEGAEGGGGVDDDSDTLHVQEEQG